MMTAAIGCVGKWARRHGVFLWGVVAAALFAQTVVNAAGHRMLMVYSGAFGTLLAIANAYLLIERRSEARMQRVLDQVLDMQDVQYAQTKLLLECHVEQQQLATMLGAKQEVIDAVEERA